MKFIGRALAFVVFLTSQGTAQSAKTPYPAMAPLSQYLMPRDAEISLARSAGPKSVSDDAEILVLTESGFQTAVRGTNGFVCMVARSWSADYDALDVWDPKVHAPICYNALAARSQVQATIKRTQAAMAGGSQAQIQAAISAAIKSDELHTAEDGSIAYMLSNQTYLSNRVGHWRPHIMFLTPETDPKSWGRWTARFINSRNQVPGRAFDGFSDSCWSMVGWNPFPIGRALNRQNREAVLVQRILLSSGPLNCGVGSPSAVVSGHSAC